MIRSTEVSERRKLERVTASLPVRFGVSSTDRSGIAGSVSEGGLHIRTNETFKVGARVMVRIEFPNGEEVLNRGEVVWAIRVSEHLRESLEYGMGIRFVQIDDLWPKMFRDWQLDIGASR